MQMPASVLKLLRKGGGITRRRNANCLILTIGDEGAVLLHVQAGSVIARLFASSPRAPEIRTFSELSASQPKLPLVILLDTLDQSYVQQTLPPVSALSVSRLMRKRLEREFPGDYLKNALVMGREKEKRKDWIFLMAAAQQSMDMREWLALASEWPNRCPGIYLLPLESRIAVQKLESSEPELQESGTSQEKWHLLVSYNKVSGVRQVVFRNEQLILTRLAHPAYESNAEAVAGAVEQEIVSTREYIKRLMHQQTTNLMVSIIVSEDIRRHIDQNRLGAGRVRLFTPHEAAEILGFPQAALPQDRFGDGVLSVAVGCTPKLRMRLTIPSIRRQERYYLGIRAGIALAVMASLCLAAMLLISAWAVITDGRQIAALEERQHSVSAELDQSRAKAAGAKEDLEKVADVVDLYEHIGANAFGPEALMIRLSKFLAGKEKLIGLTWDTEDKKPGAPPKSALPIVLRLDIDLAPPAGADNKKIQAMAIDLINKIKEELPDYDVTNLPLPGTVAENEPIDVTLTQGTEGKVQASAPPIIHVIIKGPLENKPVAAGGSHARP